jgi:hypothetical protein
MLTLAVSILTPDNKCQDVRTLNQIRDPGETRTLNQQNRNLSFYPLNYGTKFSAGDKIIIIAPVLQVFCLILKLYFLIARIPQYQYNHECSCCKQHDQLPLRDSSRAALASRRVESNVGKGQSSGSIRSGISVHPRTAESQPFSLSLLIILLK